MPSFRYIASFPRIYSDRSLLVEPGDVVEWDEAPADGQWVAAEPDEPGTDGDTTPDEQAREDPPGTTPPPLSGVDKKTTTKRAAPAAQSKE